MTIERICLNKGCGKPRKKLKIRSKTVCQCDSNPLSFDNLKASDDVQ